MSSNLKPRSLLPGRQFKLWNIEIDKMREKNLDLKPYLRFENGFLIHVAIYQKSFGKYQLPGTVIHHIDGDRHNNTLENLISISERLHHNILNMARIRPWPKRYEIVAMTMSDQKEGLVALRRAIRRARQDYLKHMAKHLKGKRFSPVKDWVFMDKRQTRELLRAEIAAKPKMVRKVKPSKRKRLTRAEYEAKKLTRKNERKRRARPQPKVFTPAVIRRPQAGEDVKCSTVLHH